MIKDSLLYFDTPKSFFDFLIAKKFPKNWRIQEGLMNERGKQIEEKTYTLFLRELFKQKGFFRRLVSLAEVVSWLDNINFIYRLVKKLQNSLAKNVFNNIEISFEYMIKMSKRMRIDCILRYDKTILILELRTVSGFSKVRPTWDKKFQELIVYKELLSYYVTNMDIKLYALIPIYEYSKGKLIKKHYDNNENQLDYLVTYVAKYLIS